MPAFTADASRLILHPKTAISDPSTNPFSGMVLYNIGIRMDVNEPPGSANEAPSDLDCNRYAAPKLLCMLVSSDDLSDTLLVAHQRIMLMRFLPVLNSASPRPCFLSSDASWCTPAVACTLIRLVFQD